MSGVDLDPLEKWEHLGWQAVCFLCTYGGLFLLFILMGLNGCWLKDQEGKLKTSELQKISRTAMRGDNVHVVLVFINILFCCAFNYRVSYLVFPIWMKVFEVLGTVLYVVYQIMEFSATHTRLIILIKFESIVNILCIVSSLYQVINNFYLGFGFLRAYNATVHFLKIRWKDMFFSSFHLQMLILSCMVCVFVYTSAGTIYIFEGLGEIPGLDYDPTEWTMLNSCWYMIVTLSTVGYGDMYAVTLTGRVFVTVYIILGIVWFSMQTSELVEIIRANDAGLGKFTNPRYSNFVVITGLPTKEVVDRMMNELLHPDRVGNDNVQTDHIVVLIPTEVQYNELRSDLIKDGRRIRDVDYHRRLDMYVGNPLHSDDLDRVMVHKANAVYVISDQTIQSQKTEGTDFAVDDLRQLFTAVAIRRHLKVSQALGLCTKNVPVKVTLQSQKNWEVHRHPLLADPQADVDIVCFDKLTMGLLASSCFAKGFITFLNSIVTFVSEDDVSDYKDNDPLWLRQYLEGARNEIYVVPLRAKYYGRDFWELYRTLWLQKGVLGIGYVRKNGWVSLAPSGKERRIPFDASLIAICDQRGELQDFMPDSTHVVKRAQPLQISLRDTSLLADRYSRVKVLMRHVKSSLSPVGSLGDMKAFESVEMKAVSEDSATTLVKEGGGGESQTLNLQPKEAPSGAAIASDETKAIVPPLQNLSKVLGEMDDWDDDSTELHETPLIDTKENNDNNNNDDKKSNNNNNGARVITFPAFALEIGSLDDDAQVIFEIYGATSTEGGGDDDVELIARKRVAANVFIESLGTPPFEAQEESYRGETVFGKRAPKIFRRTSGTWLNDKLNQIFRGSSGDGGPPDRATERKTEFRVNVRKGAQEAEIVITPITELDARGGTKNKEDIVVRDINFPKPILEASPPRTQRSARMVSRLLLEETSDGYDHKGKHLYMIHIPDAKKVRIVHELGGTKGHIVIFDPSPQKLKYLLAPIYRRQKLLRRGGLWKKVLVVHSEPLSKVYMDLIEALPYAKGCYWVRDNLRGVQLLRTIRVHTASNIIVCEHPINDHLEGDYFLPSDASAMFLTVRLQAYLDKMRNQGYRHVPVVTELEKLRTMGYIRYWNDPRHYTHPLFAEGRVITKQFAQMLLMKSQDDVHLINVFNALMLTSGADKKAQVYEIPLSAMQERYAFSGKTWGSVRAYFEPFQIIPVALFCSRGRHNSKEQVCQRFVITSPMADVVLDFEDLVVVISPHLPREIAVEPKTQYQRRYRETEKKTTESDSNPSGSERRRGRKDGERSLGKKETDSEAKRKLAITISLPETIPEESPLLKNNAKGEKHAKMSKQESKKQKSKAADANQSRFLRTTATTPSRHGLLKDAKDASSSMRNDMGRVSDEEEARSLPGRVQ